MKKRKGTLCWWCARAAAPPPYRCVWANTLSEYPQGCIVETVSIPNTFGRLNLVTTRRFVRECPEFVDDKDKEFAREMREWRISHHVSYGNLEHLHAKVGGGLYGMF